MTTQSKTNFVSARFGRVSIPQPSLTNSLCFQSTVLVYITLFSIMSPIGAFGGSVAQFTLKESTVIVAILNGVAAGTLLFVTFFEVGLCFRELFLLGVRCRPSINWSLHIRLTRIRSSTYSCCFMSISLIPVDFGRKFRLESARKSILYVQLRRLAVSTVVRDKRLIANNSICRFFRNRRTPHYMASCS